MTVFALKQLIESLPDEMEVILQKDAEGNGYSPCAGGDANALYVPENTWSGNVYDLAESADAHCMDAEDWESVKRNFPPCLVLHPVN